MPVDPYTTSSFGSVFRDSPGLLRENGWAIPLTLSAGPVTGQDTKRPICSGTGSTHLPSAESQTILPVLREGDSISIFSIQLATANGTAGDGSPSQVSLYTSSTSEVQCRGVFTGHKDGPIFLALDLPMRVDGPAKVYIDIDDYGSPSTAYSRFIINYIKVDENDAIIT